MSDVERSAASEAWRAMRLLLLTGEGHRQLVTACTDVGITPGMLKMAMQLSTDEPLPMRELARRFQCDASYVTSIVDGLEQAGVAERRPHPSDRRVKTVALTEQGSAVLARVNADLDVAPAAFEALDENEQRQLRDLLGRLVEASGGPGPAGAVAPGAPAVPRVARSVDRPVDPVPAG